MTDHSDRMDWAWEAIRTPTDPARISPIVERLLAEPNRSSLRLPTAQHNRSTLRFPTAQLKRSTLPVYTAQPNRSSLRFPTVAQLSRPILQLPAAQPNRSKLQLPPSYYRDVSGVFTTYVGSYCC